MSGSYASKGTFCFIARPSIPARDMLVEFMRQEGCLESVKFKYLLDTSRRFAIPLLDHLDTLGITRRDGHTRYLKDESVT